MVKKFRTRLEIKNQTAHKQSRNIGRGWTPSVLKPFNLILKSVTSLKLTIQGTD